jgi:two-component system, LytTR family, sensor kinase
VRRNLRQPRIDRQFLMLFLIAAMEMAATGSPTPFRIRLFALLASQWWLQALVWLSAPIVWASRSRCGMRCASR